MLQEAPWADIVCFNTVLHGCAKATVWRVALQVLENLALFGPSANEISYNSAAAACRKASRWDLALQLLGMDMDINIVRLGAVLASHERASQWQQALRLFFDSKNWKKIDAKSLSLCFSSLALSVQWQEALEVFLATKTVGHLNDRIAYSSFLQSQVKVYRWSEALARLEPEKPLDPASLVLVKEACEAALKKHGSSLDPKIAAAFLDSTQGFHPGELLPATSAKTPPWMWERRIWQWCRYNQLVAKCGENPSNSRAWNWWEISIVLGRTWRGLYYLQSRVFHAAVAWAYCEQKEQVNSEGERGRRDRKLQVDLISSGSPVWWPKRHQCHQCHAMATAPYQAELLQLLRQRDAELAKLREERQHKETTIDFLKTKIVTLQNQNRAALSERVPQGPGQQPQGPGAQDLQLRLDAALEQKAKALHRQQELYVQLQHSTMEVADLRQELTQARAEVARLEAEMETLRRPSIPSAVPSDRGGSKASDVLMAVEELERELAQDVSHLEQVFQKHGCRFPQHLPLWISSSLHNSSIGTAISQRMSTTTTLATMSPWRKVALISLVCVYISISTTLTVAFTTRSFPADPPRPRRWRNKVPKAERVESLQMHFQRLQSKMARTETWKQMDSAAFCRAVERHVEAEFHEIETEEQISSRCHKLLRKLGRAMRLGWVSWRRKTTRGGSNNSL
eukprot:symbB.v1.2.033003.t1/scaffold3971.1/size48227/2